MLNQEQILQFQRDGYLIMQGFSEVDECQTIIDFAQQALNQDVQPIEYEADTRYPGAPVSRHAKGGKTARRLLQAYARSPLLARWATQPKLVACLKQLLGSEIFLSQVHHNCIMTKQAEFSSLTGWHRDSRYWQFQRAQLITTWFALRNENEKNGCLWVMPGSHRWEIQASQLDDAQFLRTDLPQNQTLLATAVAVQLKAGDALLFSSNLFHAAGRNQTKETKFSMVFTYRASDNLPQQGSRSASLLEIKL